MKKNISRILMIAVVIAVLLLTTHLVVNNLDLAGFMRAIHGG